MKQTLFFFLAIVLASCNSGNDEYSDDNFDRGAMLVNWADNIIIPAYQNYEKELVALVEVMEIFTNDPTEDKLVALRNQWQTAYMAWQWVAMFEIGRAEALNLQSFTNMYPTNTTEIEINIELGEYNLALPSRRDQQGFPAIDYLINGLGTSEAAIVAKYTDTQYGAAYKAYLEAVVSRLHVLTNEVVEDWNSGYRGTFVDNDGSSATGAVNKVANDFIYYYEKNLRASKIGIPAGVFSGTADAKDVEAYYGSSCSKALYTEALSATRAFFNGQHFSGTATGEGFSSYLDYLNSIKEGEDLVKLINDQFAIIETTSAGLSDDLAEQVITDNNLMYNTYDELHKNVVNFKTVMLQVLNIKVDYVDADGD